MKFIASTTFLLHSRQVSESSKASGRYGTITENKILESCSQRFGLDLWQECVCRDDTKEVVERKDSFYIYVVCPRTQKIEDGLFGSDNSKYSLIPPYMDAPKSRGDGSKPYIFTFLNLP
ncbi:unnamed protein product [Albugo candida]|uniref:Uncharacterized protein n=1 Tax=Albugo candida TaxID=65357 RepID=A0A024FVS9_9STRA|nr:unnamed protein product [Albugo candida]|eukprot:CCI10977.1 unnamed protein product [Albugo candida]